MVEGRVDPVRSLEVGCGVGRHVTSTINGMFQKRYRWGGEGALPGQTLKEDMRCLGVSLFHLSRGRNTCWRWKMERLITESRGKAPLFITLPL